MLLWLRWGLAPHLVGLGMDMHMEKFGEHDEMDYIAERFCGVCCRLAGIGGIDCRAGVEGCEQHCHDWPMLP